MIVSRREFIEAACAAAALPCRAAAAGMRADLKWGYAAITWDGNDRQAIDDIAAVGFRGIQLRSPVLEQFGDKPQELRALLADRGLTMVALSSGSLRLDPAVEQEELAKHLRHAAFVRDVGGLYLQMFDERPKGRAITAADYARSGQLLTTLGRRTAELGIPIAYHHHMNNLGERPDEIDAVMEAADPRYVKLLLDVAHYQQGGGDPVAAVRKYGERIVFLHMKDLESPAPGGTGDLSRSYRFVELGRGKVDLRGVMAALDALDWKGWAVVELDRVPDPGRTPKEAAALNRAFIEKQLGQTLGR